MSSGWGSGNSKARKEIMRERRPRRIIHDAQEECFTWEQITMRSHQGIETRFTPEQAARNYHAAVLKLWSVLRPYRSEKSVEHRWKKTIEMRDDDGDVTTGFDVSGVTIESLEDLRKIAYLSTETTRNVRHPTKGTTRERNAEPVVMSPEQSTLIMLRLNDIAHTLGFRATADKLEAPAERNTI